MHNWLSKLLPRRSEEKAAALPFAGPWRSVSWADPSFGRLSTEGYSRNAAVFACISALAIAYPEAPLRVIRERDGAMVADGPLAELLRRPNPIMSWSELDAVVITYAAIGGACRLHKVRARPGGPVLELWPYHAAQLWPVSSDTDWISHYEYEAGGGITGTRRVPVEDVIDLKWPSVDPGRPWLALPPLVAAAREVDTLGELTRYLYALLVNDATPHTVVKLPAGIQLKQEQFERLRQSWERRHSGENRGRVAILEGGADVATLSPNLEQLAWEALSRVPEARVAAAFRVPAIVAGLHVGLERATYANYGEARQVMTEDTIVPMWRAHADELTQALADDFGGGVTIQRDLSQVAALQENQDAVYGRVISAWDGALITRNEARAMLGLPRVEELVLAPGTPALPPGDTFATTTTPAAPMLPPMIDVTPEGQRARSRTVGEAWAHAVWKDRQIVERKANSTDPIERSAMRAVQLYLGEEYRRAAEGISDPAGDPVAVVDQLGLDLGPRISTLMRRFYPLLLGAGWEDAGAAIAIDLAFDVDNPLIQTILGQLARQVTNVAETTRDEIRLLVGRSASEGWSIDRLKREIIQHGVTASPVRAEMIAITETAKGYSLGSRALYRESGVVSGTRWLTTDNACPVCDPLNGKVAALEDGEFAEGIAHPPAHPRCRCAIAPVVR